MQCRAALEVYTLPAWFHGVPSRASDGYHNGGILAQMRNALLHSTRRDFVRRAKRAKEDTPWEKRVQSQKLPRGLLKI